MDKVNEITRDCFNALTQIRHLDERSQPMPEVLYQRMSTFVQRAMDLAHQEFGPQDAQDIGYAIVALTDFTETNGATRLVSGSHLRPDLQRSSGRLDRHPDEELVLLRAGSALVFDGHVLHSGTPNASTAERPALQIVWRA